MYICLPGDAVGVVRGDVWLETELGAAVLCDVVPLGVEAWPVELWDVPPKKIGKIYDAPTMYIWFIR